MVELKILLISSNFLAHFDPTLPIVVMTDASEYGIDGVSIHWFLEGKEEPEAFVSRSLRTAEYSVIERKPSAIIFTDTKYHYYL